MLADTCDILLFQTNTNGARLIRAYTGSEFDHVALVIKLKKIPDDVFFVEAT